MKPIKNRMTDDDRTKTLSFETKPLSNLTLVPIAVLYCGLGGAEPTTESSGKSKAFDWMMVTNGWNTASSDAHASSSKDSRRPLLKFVNITF